MTPGPADEVPLYDLCRAVLSRPKYYSSVAIQGSVYADAGYCCRNPSMEAIRELDSGRAKDSEGAIDCLVSIGCGSPNHTSEGEFFNHPKKSHMARSKQEKMAAYDSDLTHGVTSVRMEGLEKAYFRLDPNSDLWKIPMGVLREGGEKLMRNKNLEAEVLEQLDSREMRGLLSNCAKRLVAHKRDKLK